MHGCWVGFETTRSLARHQLLGQLRWYDKSYNGKPQTIVLWHSIKLSLNPRRACAARVMGLSVSYSTSHFSNIGSSHKRYDVLNGQ